jgi:hypothetical protein
LADWTRVARGHRWYLFGAQAVNVFGRPRLTADVDVTLEWARPELGALVKKAREHGFQLLVSDPAKFLKETSVVPFVHLATNMPLDVVIAASGFEQELLKNARSIRLGGMSIPVIAPDDLVITKILAGRPKDLDDAASVLREQRGRIDLARLRRILGDIEQAVDVSDLVRTLDGIVANSVPSRARALLMNARRPQQRSTKTRRVVKKRAKK